MRGIIILHFTPILLNFFIIRPNTIRGSTYYASFNSLCLGFFIRVLIFDGQMIIYTKLLNLFLVQIIQIYKTNILWLQNIRTLMKKPKLFTIALDSVHSKRGSKLRSDLINDKTLRLLTLYKPRQNLCNVFSSGV